MKRKDKRGEILSMEGMGEKESWAYPQKCPGQEQRRGPRPALRGLQSPSTVNIHIRNSQRPVQTGGPHGIRGQGHPGVRCPS